MATVNVIRDGRRNWYGRRTWAVAIIDSTGAIDFSGYSRRDADLLAEAVTPYIEGLPVAEIAEVVAEVIFSDPNVTVTFR